MMDKQALHADDRLKERTTLSPEVLTRLRRQVLRRRLPRGTHHVRLGTEGYAVLKDVGGRHVVATVLSRHMRPPGKELRFAKVAQMPTAPGGVPGVPIPAVYLPRQSPQERAARASLPPLASGAAESRGVGLGAAVDLAQGSIASKADKMLGGYPSAGLKALGRGAWAGADKLQRTIYGDQFIDQYNRRGGMAGAAGQALGAKGLGVVSNVGTALGDASAMVGLPGAARATASVINGMERGVVGASRQAGRFVKNEITNAADTMSSMAPRPAYATAQVSAAPRMTPIPLTNPTTPVPGIGSGLQRSRLNSMIASGQLSQAGRSTAQAAGWFNPEKNVAGIERGNLALADRYGVKLTRDPSRQSEAVVMPEMGSGTNVRLLEAGNRASDHGWSQHLLRKAKATPRVEVNIDPSGPGRKFDRFAAPFDPEQMPAGFQRASDAITTRHELNEVGAMVRPAKSGKPATYRTHGYEPMPGAQGRVQPINTSMQLPNDRGGRGYHAHPNVISQEAANVNMMDDMTRNIFGRLRQQGTDEARHIYQALPDATRQSIPTTLSRADQFREAYYRMWNPYARVRRQTERNIWESPTNRAGQAAPPVEFGQ